MANQGGLDAADLINSFATGTYAVTRRRASTFDANGVAIPDPSPIALQAVGCEQPATGRDLLRLPEGRRAVETRVLYTSTLLQIGGQGSGYEADRVTIDGATWEVQQVQTWPAAVGYYRCILQAPA